MVGTNISTFVVNFRFHISKIPQLVNTDSCALSNIIFNCTVKAEIKKGACYELTRENTIFGNHCFGSTVHLRVT
jgi:hypothetical protein